MIDVLDHETSAPPIRRERIRVAQGERVAAESRVASSSRRGSKPRVVPHRPAHHTAVVMLLPLRLFLAAGWLRAAAEKLIDPDWWSGAKLRTFLTAQHEAALPFFRPVMDQVIAPNAQAVAVVVVITQLLCGLCIAIGKPMRLALRWAFLLNVVFIMTGKVNPSCFYLIMEMVMLFAIADGTIGVRPSAPSRRTVVVAAASLLFAGAMVPYVRTLEPADVIEDPAIMLVTLGVIVSITMLVRRSVYRPPKAHALRRLWTTWYAGWMHAKPKKLVRNEYERLYTPRGSRFAPPQHGTAVSWLPPLPTHTTRADDHWAVDNASEFSSRW
jgi:thiosulfate dehydrogenase [quinone] large subunit